MSGWLLLYLTTCLVTPTSVTEVPAAGTGPVTSGLDLVVRPEEPFDQVPALDVLDDDDGDDDPDQEAGHRNSEGKAHPLSSHSLPFTFPPCRPTEPGRLPWQSPHRLLYALQNLRI